MATEKQWKASTYAFNAKPLSADDIHNILRKYRYFDGNGRIYYVFSKLVGNKLNKKHPALPYALYLHKFFVDYDPNHVGEEYWILPVDRHTLPTK